jgi:ribosomal protein S18 acetylase RimI-like enzyme
VEDDFRGKGYENINLSTYRFQAPGFYQKCGFKIEFVRENKEDPRLSKYFFVKYFD